MKRTPWNKLTPAQREQVMRGDACGHPTNRPKSEQEAADRLWFVRDDKVIGWEGRGSAAFTVPPPKRG